MPEDPRAKEDLERLDRLRTLRMPFHKQWEDVRNLVRPISPSFQGVNSPGAETSIQQYDGTAPWALEQLAAGLNSSLSSPSDRWFFLGGDDPLENFNDEELLWLEGTADILYNDYATPESNLHPSLNEAYLDIGGFGTSVTYQDYDWYEGLLKFRAYPLADCFIDEDSNGRVNTLVRRTKMSVSTIREFFDDKNLPKEITEEKDPTKQYVVIHSVFPKEGWRWKYMSRYVIEDLKVTVKEGGYDSFPYHVPRWTKMAGELYGRSPAMNCLADIRMVNQMLKVTIKAAQKIVDPPLIVPDDGFILPIRTIPGSLLFKAAGQEDTIQALKTEGRIDIGQEMVNATREQIIKAFYVDWILRQKKKERQTAVEIMDDRNEMLRQMSPMLGRITVELVSPLIRRSYELKSRAGAIRPAPDTLGQRTLRIHYVSPAVKAQLGSKAIGLQAFIQDIAAMSQFAPDAGDIIDTDMAAAELAKYRDVSRRVIRSAAIMAEIRQRRAQQQQIAAMAQHGRDMAAGIKDLATAQSLGGAIPA